MKKGTKVRIIPNGLKASDHMSGITPRMTRMQGKIYSVEATDDKQIKINGFWFSKQDVTEHLIDEPNMYVDNALFNPENLDL